ncbi:MAG: hydroxyisourate hydrolase [Chloroflexota bacterium]
MAQEAKLPGPTISTHILDTGRGMPAVGVHVTLYRLADDGKPIRLTQALTDDDGRVRDLLERPLTAGDYRIDFNLGRGAFFERMSVDVHITDVTRSYHVPLLMSPFSMATYRGS